MWIFINPPSLQKNIQLTVKVIDSLCRFLKNEPDLRIKLYISTKIDDCPLVAIECKQKFLLSIIYI